MNTDQNIEARPEYEEAMMGSSAGHRGAGLHLLNTTLCPTEGTYHVRNINPKTAIHLFRYMGGHGLSPINHLGHQAACDAFMALGFGHLEVDRTPWDGFGLGLCLQLRGRIPEGSILTREAMEEVGADLRLIYQPPAFERGLDEVVQLLLRSGVGRLEAYKAVELFRALGATSRTVIRPWVTETADDNGQIYHAVRTRP